MYKTWLAVIILVTLFIAAIPIHTSRVSAQAGTGTQTPTLQPIFAVQTVTPESDGSVVHKVLPGQTLFGIAEAYQVSVTTIAALNNLATPYTIFPGDLLIISPKPTPTVTLEATETQQATRVPTATRRPPTATPTATLVPAATLTPTATPWLRPPTITLDSKSLGMIIIAICVLGLVIVGFTSFRKQ